MTPLIRIAIAILIALLIIRVLAPAFAEKIKIIYLLASFALVISVGLFLYALLG